MEPFFRRIAVFLFAGLLFPALSFGHGVEARDVTDAAGRAARSLVFQYSTGEPMMYAKVKLYPPSQPDMEILQGSTDRSGLFSFVPDEDGEWRVVADDGMGHGGTIAVQAASGTGMSAAAGASAAGTLSRPLAAILGLSLIINVFALWNFFGAKKKGGADAH